MNKFNIFFLFIFIKNSISFTPPINRVNFVKIGCSSILPLITSPKNVYGNEFLKQTKQSNLIKLEEEDCH